MEKVKRWILVLSSCCLGSAVAIGFASYKITNPIKNETSFVIKGDGDVSEQRGSFIRIDSIDLPTIYAGGFKGEDIEAPGIWGTSDSGAIGFPFVGMAKISVGLTLNLPHDNLYLKIRGTRTDTSGTTTGITEVNNYISHIVSVASADGTFASQAPSITSVEDSHYSEAEVAFPIPDSRKTETNKPMEFIFSIDFQSTEKALLQGSYLYTNNGKRSVSFSAAFVREANA